MEASETWHWQERFGRKVNGNCEVHEWMLLPEGSASTKAPTPSADKRMGKIDEVMEANQSQVMGERNTVCVVAGTKGHT